MVERVPCEKCGNLVVSSSRLCPVCRENPNSMRNALGCVVVAGLLAWGGIQTVAHKLGLGTATRTEASAASVSSAPEASTDASPESTSETMTRSTEERSADGSTDDASSSQGDAEAASDASPVVDEAAASAAEGSAITAALESGEDQDWSAGGLSGRIKVKSADVEGQSLCRKYRAERDGKKSAYSTVCRTDAGAWQVSE